MKSKDKEDETNGRAWLSTVPEVVEMCAFELKLCPRQLFLFAPTPTRKGVGVFAPNAETGITNLIYFSSILCFSIRKSLIILAWLCFVSTSLNYYGVSSSFNNERTKRSIFT